MKKIVPVILSGGSGSRLWPLSREKTPKQFLQLMDKSTLLQKTAMRAGETLGNKNLDLVTVTLDKMYEETARQLQEISPAYAQHILLEPEARNTAAAVALAIHYVENIFGEDTFIWVLPADHHIENQLALKEAVLEAYKIAQKGHLVTFGIKPTRPETGYGYICKGAALDEGTACKVEKFIEKPDLLTATQLVNSGKYLWSSGMHLFQAKTGRNSFINFAPGNWNLIARAVAKSGNYRKPSLVYYSQIVKEPFETAVIEKTEKLAVIPCDPGWSDIGCWESIWEVRDKDLHGNVMTGSVFYEDTHNSMVLAESRLVTCVGIKDIVVVETHDSVLVADKKCNGSLKNLIQQLQQKKREETIFSSLSQREWGVERTIIDTPGIKIFELTIKAGYALAGQIMCDASQLIVAGGSGELVFKGKRKAISKNDTITLSQDTLYSLHNSYAGILKIFLIQNNRTTEETVPDMLWDVDPEISTQIAA